MCDFLPLETAHLHSRADFMRIYSFWYKLNKKRVKSSNTILLARQKDNVAGLLCIYLQLRWDSILQLDTQVG